MDRQEFNRVFDQVRPSREQKERMLYRLLEPEKEVFPVKKLRKLTVIGIAAALMVITCAAAVVTGIDQRLLDYFNAGPEQAELLASGAEALDITITDNDATLHITQVLKDRYSVLVLAEFTAPEGTVLNEKSEGLRFDTNSVTLHLLDKDGADLNVNTCYSWGWRILEDGDPADNHLSMLFSSYVAETVKLDQRAAYFLLDAKNLVYFDSDLEKVILYPGDWSVQLPLPEKDTGWIQEVDDPVVKEIYLSPMNIHLSMSLENLNKERLDKGVTLTSPDGQTISARQVFGGGTGTGVGDLSWQRRSGTFQLTEVTDPAQFQGGTLTLRIGGGSVDIPLDGLIPAE